MLVINPYLNFAGNTEEAFNFYKSVFGGEFSMLQRFDGVPGCDGMPVTEKEKIMHVALPVKGNTLMATDVLESMGQHLVVGTNFSLSIHAESKEEADDLYAKLSAGGAVTMPMQNMFWGSYYGMLTDKFGIQWMISFDGNTPGGQ